MHDLTNAELEAYNNADEADVLCIVKQEADWSDFCSRPGRTCPHRMLYNGRQYGRSRAMYHKLVESFINVWCPLYPIRCGDNVIGFRLRPFTIGWKPVLSSDLTTLVAECGEKIIQKLIHPSKIDEMRFQRNMKKPLLCTERSGFSSEELKAISAIFALGVGPITLMERKGKPFDSLVADSAAVHRNAKDGNLTATCITLDTHSAEYTELVLFFGGKDMLALDALHFVSSIYAFAFAQKNTNRRHEKIFASIDYEIILAEYPGYGFNNSFCDTASIHRDMCKLIDLVIQGRKPAWQALSSGVRLSDDLSFEFPLGAPFDSNKKYSAIRVIGYSLGTFVALQAAKYLAQAYSQYELNVILLAPPVNIRECTADALKVPDFLRSVVIRCLTSMEPPDLIWNSVETINELLTQVMENGSQYVDNFALQVLHGLMDQVVRYQFAQDLVTSARAFVSENAQKHPEKDNMLELARNLTRRLVFKGIKNAGHTTILNDKTHIATIMARMQRK